MLRDHRPGTLDHTGDGPFRLAELILPFSIATDIGTGEPIESALRACVLAVHLGAAAGLSDAELSDVYYVVLLRYAGCTANAATSAALFGDEKVFRAQTQTVDYGDPVAVLRAMLRYSGSGKPPLERFSFLFGALGTMLRDGGELIAAHCEVAEMLAARLGMSPGVQAALRQTSGRWDGTGAPARLRGESIALPMRVAQLAQNAAVFYRLGGVDLALWLARRWSGGAFDPRLVEVFCQAAPRLCASLEEASAWEAALAAEPGARPRLSAAQLEDGTRAMADFVDLKSPFTLGHSSGVADLAASSAERCGLSPAEVVCVRQAGYLHELGEISLPLAIWSRAGALTDAEWERMRLHPYYNVSSG